MSNDEKYRKLYESLQNANRQLHQQLLVMQQRMVASDERAAQAVACLRTQERVTEQRLLESNKSMNAVLEENETLKAEIKRLRDGTIH